MFDVLVYVYEHYGPQAACGGWRKLEQRLSAQGFDARHVEDAVAWLRGLDFAAEHLGRPEAPLPVPPSRPAPAGAASSLRVYSTDEQDRLGRDALGFICFLEGAGVLPPALREVVIDRALDAAEGESLPLAELKVIVLMVYWRFGTEPGALVLDELSDDADQRVAH